MVFGQLSLVELQRAKLAVFRLHQEQEFSKKLINLQQGKSIENNSRLMALNLFLNEDGVMRVGGRLTHAPLSFSQRFPIIVGCNLA